MLSFFARNVFFTLLQPGIVAGLIPCLILRDSDLAKLSQSFTIYQYMGTVAFVTGTATLLGCIIRFAVVGKGTLSPADPTKKLVVTGLYKYSRNPMYIGVMLILLGEAVFFRSVVLLVYAMAVFSIFNIFIVFFEEPRLRREFKDAYTLYCKKVARWF